MLKRVLLFMSVLTVLSCAQTEVLNKDLLKIGVPVEAVTLFPYGSNDNATARMTVNIFDRLLEKDEKGQFQPGIASSWEVLSPVQVKFNLRTNAVFHNGELLTAEDVKYSIERAIVSPEVEHIASPIKNVEIIDPYTIMLNLKDPFAPILSHLAHSTMGILNKKAAEAAGQDIDQNPVGTGPYKLKAWNRGQNTLLEAHTEYWGEAPKIANLEFRVIPEASARTIALETGDIDIAYDIDAIDRERVSESADLQLIEEAIARIEYLGFNIEKGKNPIWKDRRVREAVTLAIDTDGIINSVLFGSGTPADSVIYKTVVGHYAGLTPRKRDVAKAKALLAEAGVKPGLEVSAWTSEGQRQKMLEVIQANLKEIGINLKIEVYEWARFLDGTGKGEHDMFVLGWTTVTGDADYGIYNLIHTKAFGGAGNRSFYSNPEVDVLLDNARKEIDPVKRNAMYKTIQEVLYDDIPFIPLFYKLANVGASKKVKGFLFDPADSHRLQTVYFGN